MPHQSIFQAEAMPLLNYITQGVKLIDLEGDGRLVDLAWAGRMKENAEPTMSPRWSNKRIVDEGARLIRALLRSVGADQSDDNHHAKRRKGNGYSRCH
jgi:hypothetical protein